MHASGRAACGKNIDIHSAWRTWEQSIALIIPQNDMDETGILYLIKTQLTLPIARTGNKISTRIISIWNCSLCL
jgi:hypothetical protein